MSRRLLLPLGLTVSGLLVLAAVASRGRPLGGGSNGTGPTAGFFDYVFTTIVLLGAAVTVALVVTLSFVRPARGKGPAPQRHYFISMLSLAGALVLAWALVHSGFEKRLQHLEQQPKHPSGPTQTWTATPASKTVRGARLRWDEVAIVLGLLAAAAVVVVVTRSRARLPASLGRGSHRAVSLALDESLDDLRTEPDLRKAIIAAYARMERALAGAGLPRRAAEAPVEYLERALLSLDTSASAVRRLTDLFEWAKFSQHDPEPSMRDEAVDALAAVRDELRAPEPVTVTV